MLDNRKSLPLRLTRVVHMFRASLINTHQPEVRRRAKGDVTTNHPWAEKILAPEEEDLAEVFVCTRPIASAFRLLML